MLVRAGAFFAARPSPLKDGRAGMPVVRQLRILGSLVRCDGTLGSDGEVDPAVAVRASADESVPFHQCAPLILDGTSVILQVDMGVSQIYLSRIARPGPDGNPCRATQSLETSSSANRPWPATAAQAAEANHVGGAAS